MHSIITIGRQYGSGGRLIGKRLAEELDIPYYDREILTLSAQESGIGEELFQEYDEKPTRSFLFSLVAGMPGRGGAGAYYMDMPLNHKIFLAQFDTIKRIASQGPCVIVGRCADYVLSDNKNAVNVFVKASMEVKKQRVIAYYGIDKDKAEDVIIKTDKRRASYYNYYANTRWGDLDNYHLVIDSGALGIDGSAAIIREFINGREGKIRAEAKG